jgi:hypothetical protein
MTYSDVPCDACHVRGPCRVGWIDDGGLPCHFCNEACMNHYRYWLSPALRRGRVNQDKTEQNRTRQCQTSESTINRDS